MNGISVTRFQWLSRALTALLVIALGAQLAWWAWHFITPSLRGPAVVSPSGTTVDVNIGRQLFGDAGTVNAASGGAPGGIRLRGVYSTVGTTLSAAVLNLGGRDQAVNIGQAFAPGVTLAEVHADHVIISRSGVRERIDLDRFENRAAKLAASAPATQLRLNVTSTGTNAYALSRQELNGVFQDPRQWAFTGRIVNAPNGGVRFEEAPSGSLPDKLGIKPGDIITGINGQPVNSQGDLVRLYQQFGTLQVVRAEVRRGGAPVMLSYTIQN
jgi:general secretion pathway protein C